MSSKRKENISKFYKDLAIDDTVIRHTQAKNRTIKADSVDTIVPAHEDWNFQMDYL